MTPEEIRALTDEELNDNIVASLMAYPPENHIDGLWAEAHRRSALAASQRAARGEQPLPMEESDV